jgi:hypothetical protein
MATPRTARDVPPTAIAKRPKFTMLFAQFQRTYETETKTIVGRSATPGRVCHKASLEAAMPRRCPLSPPIAAFPRKHPLAA